MLGQGDVPFGDIFSAESPPFVLERAEKRGDVQEDKAKLGYFYPTLGYQIQYLYCLGGCNARDAR